MNVSPTLSPLTHLPFWILCEKDQLARSLPVRGVEDQILLTGMFFKNRPQNFSYIHRSNFEKLPKHKNLHCCCLGSMWAQESL